MGMKTPLYEQHIAAGGKMVDFAGWEMPIHYGSQLNEHHAVRLDAGVFDVSHMTIIDVEGPDSKSYLRYLLANDIEKLKEPGRALYSCMLNEQGGIIDDLIVYYIADETYRLVVNASTREKDLAWLIKQAAKFRVSLRERRDLAIVAIQGPNARKKIHSILPQDLLAKVEALAAFQFILHEEWMVARTGYTGEEGYEVILPAGDVINFWQAIISVGIKPCGLGARDTLRLEAGLNLYGADMDETITPLESNLTWTIAWQPEDRNFIGRSALTQQQQRGIVYKLVGLVLLDRGVLRSHQPVIVEGGDKGETTSGTFSPTLNKGIALARVPATITEHCQVDIRGKFVEARVIKPPFIKQGKPNFLL